jgi:hypothetical protein
MKISLKTLKERAFVPRQHWLLLTSMDFYSIFFIVSDDEEFALVPAETQEVVDCLKF